MDDRLILISILTFVFCILKVFRRPQLTIQDCQSIFSFEKLEVYRDQKTQDSKQAALIKGDRISCVYLKEEGFGYVKETFDIKVRGFWGNLNVYLENDELIGTSLNHSIRRRSENRRENFLIQKIIADIQRAMMIEEVRKKNNVAITPALVNAELPDYVRN